MDEIKRYKCVVSYDGSNYNGFQSQNNSIQKVIELALSKLTNSKIKIYASGRTDAKVHAYGQVFHFETDKQFNDLKHSINALLPNDIYVNDVTEVSEQFHARFSAKGKHYDYLINNGVYQPTLRNYCCYVDKKLDIKKMKEAASVFIGTHDFTSFNATKIDEIADQVRTISMICINEENNGMIRISFYGDGFLRYMVRMISKAIIDAGLSKISPQQLVQMLETKDKNACSFNGEPQGLYLVEVYY